jgi:G3E family GTPase
MKKIPLTIITGFLGSGKTTLINRILKENKGLKIALIVNEFGDVALESQFIEKTDEEIVEMSNGCMCCVVRKDIVDTVENLLEKRPDVDYIIVEASGLSDPKPIAETFAMTLTDRIRLDAILCVVDALNIEKNFENYEIASDQILFADMVLVSKTAMMSPARYQEIRFFIKKLNPFMRVIPIDDSLSLEMILDVQKFDYSKVEELQGNLEHHHEHDEHCSDPTHHHHHEHHHEKIDEVFIKIQEPLDMNKFSDFIKNLPEAVVRAKGFLYSLDSELR